ncbi:MAG TPA: glutathione S-transferase C-terminal domain-containing protein [Stellaceae bacterium]|jgi:glutathione S-transferase|nr:glutathione S-transferase C-terminal domain-containing protein [Stellaceae bacterium]
MKLYYSPGACSIGIHVLLEEAGKPYSAQVVSLPNQEQYGDVYKAINPKSKVPTLERDDGSVLTEFPAIATWIALTNPEKKLLPEDVDGKVRALEVMDYCVATIHMQGFARQFRPANFGPNEADHDKVKARGREIMDKGFALMNQKLAGKDYVLGNFSIADAALFYVEFWAANRFKLELPEHCAAHYRRMIARPAVAKAIADEGLTLA